MGNAMQAVEKPCFSQYLLLPFAYKLLGLHVHVGPVIYMHYEQLQKNQVNNKLTNVSYAKYLNGTTDRITVVAINFLLSRDSRL